MNDGRKFVTWDEFRQHPFDMPYDWFIRLDDAPEKDWTPLCFSEHSMADSKFCDGEHEVNWLGYVQKELREECLKCPWLKR